MRNEQVLVVDDSPEIRSSFCKVLRTEGFTVEVATDGEDAIEKLESRSFDVVFTDIAMPRKDGLDLLQYIRSRHPETCCIVVTGYGSIEGAVEAMRAGAFEYLTKPVSPEEIIHIVEKAVSSRNGGRPSESSIEQNGFLNIVGKSPAIRHVFDIVKKVASADSTVLITGESGTGKELIAQAIHMAGDRRNGPFVPVNCAAIPEELLESELFGHEKGAFTHAIRTRIGRFELANKGTIFLDEIGDMSPSLQVKLLRVLQERRFERVGGMKTVEIDIRVIAATNIDLEEAVKEGRFREDLYYRLNVIPIKVPPLRERVTDIPLLLDYFLEKCSSRKGASVKGIDETARQCLLSYDWPGNVRELENVMERMVILSNGPVITVEDLPERIAKAAGITSNKAPLGQEVGGIVLPEEGLCLSKAVEEFEKSLIIQALDRTNWVKNRAAKLLQMNRTTLIEKMKKQKLMVSKEKRSAAKKRKQDADS